MRHCGSCFRYQENEKDAQQKGMKVRGKPHLLYSQKPRKHVDARCTGVWIKKGKVKKREPACEAYRSRWNWNLLIVFEHIILHKMERLICDYIRRPIGRLRKPVKLMKVDNFGNRVPMCPHCGEMPYSFKECVFCGQRFEEETNE